MMFADTLSAQATRKRAAKAALREKAGPQRVARKASVSTPRPVLPASRPGMRRVVYAEHGWLAAVANGTELQVKRRIEAGQDMHVRDEVRHACRSGTGLLRERASRTSWLFGHPHSERLERVVGCHRQWAGADCGAFGG